MAPFVLKFKGNKSFSPLSQISDSDTLTKTWKVCTKVAQHLEQGQRLENLSWRLWFLQFALVQADNAKSKREFKKLGKHMSDKLDKDKNRSIAELEAPHFKRTDSTEKVRARVEEMERNREHGKPFATNTQNGMRTMQYTFALDPNVKPLQSLLTTPSHSHSQHTEDLSMRVAAPHRPKSHKHSSKLHHQLHDANAMDIANDLPSTTHHSAPRPSHQLSFPTIFSSDLGPTALLCPAPTTSARMTYGDAAFSIKPSDSSSTSFAISRPTFEFPIDEFLKGEANEWGMDPSTAAPISDSNPVVAMDMQMQALEQPQAQQQQQGQQQQTIQPTATSSKWPTSVTVQPTDVHPASVSSSLTTVREDQVMGPPPVPSSAVATSAAAAAAAAASVAAGAPATKAAARQGPSATPPTRNTNSSHNPGNSAPGGVKSECANCGATHTPLWRRGLNDELNCNACGLYCKLHKRARPKNLRASHGERSGTAWAKSTGANGTTAGVVVGVEGASTTADVVGDPVQCHNCSTMATPLWRKDDEGNTLCNACGLYLKLHGTKRPLSMKSDVIRKRSRHESEKRSSGSGAGSAGVLGGGSTPVNALNSRRTSPTPPPPSASPTSPSETFTTPAIGPNSLDGIPFPFSADFNFSYTRDDYNSAGTNNEASSSSTNLLGDMFGSGGFGTYSNMLAYGPEPNPAPSSAFSTTSTLSNSLAKSNHFNHYRSNSNATVSSQATFQFSPPLRPFEEDVSDHYHSEESSIRKKRRLTAESSFSGSSLAHTTGGRTSANSSPTGGLGAISDLGSLSLGSQISPQSPPYFSLDFIQYQNQSGAQQQQQTQQQHSSSSPPQDGNGNVIPGVTHDYYGFPLHPPMAPLHPPSLVSPYANGTHDISQMMPLYLDESGGEAANAATPTGSGEFHHALQQRRASQHQQTHHYQYHVMPKEEEMYVHTDMFADNNGGQQQNAADAGGSMHSHIHYQQGSI